MKKELDILAKQISVAHGFKIHKKIYEAFYYSFNQRNVIYSGLYKNRPAVLKIYDDPRMTDESISLKNFNKVNKSKILKSPALYKYKIISPNKGWLIMEKLPDGGSFLKSPLNCHERKDFLNAYLEYKKNFPKKPSRNLSLVEKMPANKFHIFRINRWLELATVKEFQRKKPILEIKEFFPRFAKAIELIDKEFANRKMEWLHGHFKPKEIYRAGDVYYLTDFAHSKMYPEGYEFSFMVWADYFMTGNWKLNYKDWKKGIDDWIEDLRAVADKLKIKDYDSLIEAALTERAIGTILADICASDKPRTENVKRIKLLYNLIDELT